MNNLTRVLLGSVSAAAIMFGVQTGAVADTANPNGGGAITYGAGGTATDDTLNGSGLEIQTVGNDTVNVDSVTINKFVTGPTPDALNINNGSGAGSLTVTFSGTGSDITEQADGGAALNVDNSGGSGEVSLDTTGSSSASTFRGTNGIVVKGTGFASVVLGPDTIIAIQNGTGSTTAGLSVSAGSEADISTAANIGADGSGHYFDYGINLTPSDANSLNFITVDAGSRISAATADINVTNGSVTINQYGTLDHATNSIVLTGGGNANINLFAGSSTGNIDLTGDGGGSIVSLYAGTVNANAVPDAQTGQTKQFAGAVPAAVFGTITGSGFDELDLRGNGDGTVAGGAVGQIDLSSTGGISGFGDIAKKDNGTWQFFNGAGDAATNQSPSIFLEQGTIQAMAEGAFGGGTIEVDNAGSFGEIEYSATGTFANAIALNVSAPTLSTGAVINVDSGVTATLSGAITSSASGQTVLFNGPGTAVLTNTNNSWTGGTQIDGNGTVSIGQLSNIGSGAITLGGATTSGTLEDTHTGGTVESAAQNFVINAGGGTINLVTDGLNIDGVVSGSGDLTKTGSGTLTLYGDNTYTGATNISAGTLALGSTSVGPFPPIITDGSIASSSAVNLTDATSVLDVSAVGNGAAVIHNLSGVANSHVTFGTKGLTINSNTATTFAGVLQTGTGDLTISGTGDLTLTGANTYAGTTIIDSGATLTLASGGTLNSGNDVEIDGGTFEVATNGQTLGAIDGSSGNLTLDENADLTATSLSGTHAVTLAGNTILTVSELSGTGSMSFGTDPASDAALNVGDPNNTEYDGNISSTATGVGGIFKVGAGTLTLGGNNSNYTGYIEIDAGTLQAGSTAAFGGAYVYASTGTTLDLNGFNNAIYSLHGPGTVTDGNTTPATLELYNGSSNGSAFTGVIQDGAGQTGLQLDGGTLTLTTASTYTGKTTIESGATLALSGSGAIGGGDVEIDGGTFEVDTNGQHLGNITGTGGNLSLGQDADLTATSLSGNQNVTLASNSSLLVGALSGTGSIVIGTGADGDAELIVGDANNTAYNGNISSAVTGTGAIFKEGSGTLTLGDNNTNYTGYLEVDDGTLQAGSTAAFGGIYLYASAGTTVDLDGFNNAIYSLHGPGTVTDSSTTPVTLELYNGSLNGSSFTGVIQDGAGKTSIQVDGGTLTMTNVNTFSGTTTIENGAGVALTGSGSIANSSVNDMGTLDTTAATTPAATTFASLSGNGTVNAAAASTLTITNGTGTFSGTLNGVTNLTVSGGVFTAGTSAALSGVNVTLAGGGLGYGDGVTLANAVVLAGDNAQLDVETGTATQSGAITETGGPRDLDKTGAGTLVITTPVAYTGTTDVEAGTLRAGVANAFATSSNIVVASGATLDLGGFNQSVAELSGSGDLDLGSSQFTVGSDNASTTFSGVLSGTGSLVKTGTGTLTLSGDNTYSGGTTIEGGEISVQSDHALGTGALTMADPVLDYGNGVTISNAVVLAANDAQFQVTTGAATQAGVISETGGSRPFEKIGAGELTLSATNTYSGATTVTAGTLNVTGSIAASSLTTVASGATLTGAGTVGNTTVASGATIAPGVPAGTLNVNGNLTLASGSNYNVSVSPATASQADVTGTATLGGATLNTTYAGGSYVSKQYTLLMASGGVNGTFGSEVDTNLPANFTSSLSYDANDVFLNLKLAFVSPTGITRNQNNVGNTIVNFFNTTGAIPLTFSGLTPAGLSEASGEVATASAQAARDAQGQFVQVALDPRSGSVDHGWHLWGGVYGGGRSTDGDSSTGSHDLNDHSWGAAIGADYRISDNLVAGAAYSGGRTSFHLSDDLGSGSANVNQGIVYLKANLWDAAYLSGAYAFGSQDATTHRATDMDGPAVYRASFSGDIDTWRAEGGWRFETDDFGLIPYAAIQSSTYSSPNYAEKTVSGTNTFALNYAGEDMTAARTELGLRADHAFDMDGSSFLLRARAAWVDNYELDHSLRAGFQTLPGTAFAVDGAVEGRNGALLGLSGEWQIQDGLSLSAGVDGGFSNHSTAYTGQGVLRYTW